METFYTSDKTTQIVLYLMKAHGIRKVIVSPGTTNIALVGSMQIDPFFELYSAVDERSAAYMACGMAFESGEAVALTCTEATASRNYFPGLTEAFYRKLPILAITGTHGIAEVGHLKPQVIDRKMQPFDTVRLSVNLDKCKDKHDEWSVNVLANRALLELMRNEGGPVRVNLNFSGCTFNVRQLPATRVIKRYSLSEELPPLPHGRIAVFVGSHKPWLPEETEAVDRFCSNHNAVVFCDKTSGYTGKYRIDYAIVAAQLSYSPRTHKPDLLIHIGEVSGDTYTQNTLKPQQVWRVSEDGELRDTFKKLKSVFAMSEQDFFNRYSNVAVNATDEYIESCRSEYESIVHAIPEIGFSNFWIAQVLADKIPKGSVIHFGIFNSLRSWNMSPWRDSLQAMCNVGVVGIDGSLSTLLGASSVHPDKLHFAIVGDLAFFYDMNALGNRHVSSNLRILIVNNGRGTEFCKFDHPCAVFGENANPYMAATGHFGNQTKTLVKNYVESLGFCYITASSQEEFLDTYKTFVSEETTDKPIVFEVFTDSVIESEAIDSFRHIKTECLLQMKNKAKDIVKTIIRK